MDDGSAIHYSAVEPGTPVYGSDEVEAGTVHQVVDNYREHILDGFVIELPDGKRVFADAPEVARTAERGVTLTILAADVAALPAPDPGVGTFSAAKVKSGRLGKLFGGGWKRDR